ncbi:nucleotidyltransferase domain-containing protein [Niabella drilacis]|uniref:Predicted nucleotidyltransferase n=1 Tax=Niabella drilacis (strain DSM 25811 / CCM 8410 / CCUG 62505 / LMG 26954 / E90) TaxID=1285928 RepID=A0A1G6JRE5_NIADE|nr:nucleotidyltransferase domain-containing protein [Niabella drilacis]SDC21304.1 Predicted nucleotidyltransferase [Niabella drilacis]
MTQLTIDTIKENGWLIFECISGSKAYGLDTPASDTDIKGVFILPRNWYYSMEYIPQVSNETNDIVYYELKRFIELLAKNNPNILELLATPDDCILLCDPLMNLVKQEYFLSRLCEQSFANYAYSQIRKARGLEKKIANPVNRERKSPADFCYVYIEKKAMPLNSYLRERSFSQESMGLTSLAHFRDCYQLYHSAGSLYSGIFRKEDSNDVCTSAVPRDAEPLGLLYFNRDGYSVYCKEYREYWDWVAKRNETRYQGSVRHGKNYDSKNMMHVFRLLRMALEIAEDHKIYVRRTDRALLLQIKEGKYDYDELVHKAETMMRRLKTLYRESRLPATPDQHAANNLLVCLRSAYYDRQ